MMGNGSRAFNKTRYGNIVLSAFSMYVINTGDRAVKICIATIQYGENRSPRHFPSLALYQYKCFPRDVYHTHCNGRANSNSNLAGT